MDLQSFVPGAASGFKILGAVAADKVGWYVSGAGDLNGDGFDDVLLSSVSAMSNAGTTYVVFGNRTSEGSIDLALFGVDNTAGYVIRGASAEDQSGMAVSGAGDVNGDGLDDILVGAPGASYSADRVSAGIVYVLYGSSTSEDVQLSNFTAGPKGFRILGSWDGDACGYSVSGAGDVNGDGTSDFIISSRDEDPQGRMGAGTAHVIMGQVGNRGEDIDLRTFGSSFAGFRILGAQAGDVIGRVSGAGDVNADGYDDVIISSPRADPFGRLDAGTTYVIFGHSAHIIFPEIDFLNFPSSPALGFKIFGAISGEVTGSAVSGAGDVNGDGVDDILISAYLASPLSRNAAGKGYVLLGKPNSPTSQPSSAPSSQPTLYYKNLDLATFTAGPKGFAVLGAEDNYNLGVSVSGAGDFNGDGIADFIVGAKHASTTNRSEAGCAFVIYGNHSVPSPFQEDIDTSLLSSRSNGFVIWGEEVEDQCGSGVSSAGDFNGDGFDDIMLGCNWANMQAGAVYVHFGQADALLGSIDLRDTFSGFKILGANPGDEIGTALASAGDVNNDGFDDIIVGAHLASLPGKTEAGVVYVIFGHNNQTDIVDLTTFNTTGNGFMVLGRNTGDWMGFSVSGAGDVNGDGIDDIIIGARLTTIGLMTNAGTVYVIFGRTTSATPSVETIDLATFTSGGEGFQVLPDMGYASLGASVSAGDFNGDGLSDLLIGASGVGISFGRAGAGAAYVIYGTAEGAGHEDVDLAHFTSGAIGFRIMGALSDDRVGNTVSSAGDVNGDGVDDILLGVYLADPFGKTNAGIAYVIYGCRGECREVDLRDAAGPLWFKILGVATGDRLGYSVSGIGDVNGDGIGDIIIGAFGVDLPGKINAGAAYVLYGEPSAPTSQPSTHPSAQPSSQPSSIPTARPSSFYHDKDLLDFTSGDRGYQILGARSGDFLGDAISSAGDVNGDDVDDYIVVATEADLPDKEEAGVIYVIYGRSSGGSPFADLDLLSFTSGPLGFRILGESEFDMIGSSVSGAGDINGDGFRDIIVGASHHNDTDGGLNAGAAYIILGGPAHSEDVDLAVADHPDVIKISGWGEHHYVGWRVDIAGDFDGDGLDDVLIGAPGVDLLGELAPRLDAGVVYLIFGRSLLSGTISLSLRNVTAGASGFGVLGRNEGDGIGNSIAAAGDVNGDGYDDFMIAAYKNIAAGRINAGVGCLIFGHDNSIPYSDIDLFQPNGQRVLKFRGAAADYQLGFSLSRGGDINGDGVADIIIGAVTASAQFINAGIVVVLFGPLEPKLGQAEINDLLFAGGFQIIGAQPEGQIGYSVSGGGDLNGDGYDEIVIGARYMDPIGRTDAGSVYVIFGHSGSTTAFPDINLLNFVSGPTGFQIFGAAPFHAVGKTVACAGDVDGDGIGDLLLSAYAATASGRSQAGVAYVMFGSQPAPSSQPSSCPSSQPSGVPSSQPTSYPSCAPTSQPTLYYKHLDLATFTAGPKGFAVLGAGVDFRTGVSVSGAGDFNGDGIADFIVGAKHASTTNRSEAGCVFVIYGNDSVPSPFQENIDTSLLSSRSSTGFMIWGEETEDQCGSGVSSAGDFNGDGFDDIMLGCNWADPLGRTKAGAVYVHFGQVDALLGSINLRTAFSGFKIIGANSGDEIGTALASAGDVNNDGFDDIMVGAHFASLPGKAEAGAVYVIFGHNNLTSPNMTVDLATFNTTGNGFMVLGGNIGDRTGFDVSGAGDVNGDGIDDIIIDARFANVGTMDGAGIVYILFGRTTSFGTIDLADFASGPEGFRILGECEYAHFGSSVSAGDVNGDGLVDLLIGSNNAKPFDRLGAGAVHVIYGRGVGAVYADVDTAKLTAADGFTIAGAYNLDRLGNAVRCAGDVNGDGVDDILLGASLADPFDRNIAGTSYIIYGCRGGCQDIDLLYTAGDLWYKILGAAPSDVSGTSVSGIGDVNGDGINDFIIGAHGVDLPGKVDAGAAYVLYGEPSAPTSQPSTHPSAQPSTQPSSIPTARPSSFYHDKDLLDFTSGDRGYQILGARSGDFLGDAISSAGDVNGDGIDDYILAATGVDLGNSANVGGIYVIYGRNSGGSPFADLDLFTFTSGSLGFRILGESASDLAGRAVSGGGDINGDGFGDIIIGSEFHDVSADGEEDAGASYIILGAPTSSLSQDINLADAYNSMVIKLSGSGYQKFSGCSVAFAGDFDGDGLDDVLVGAKGTNPLPQIPRLNTGGVYLIFGASLLGTSHLSLRNVTAGVNGFVTVGAGVNDAFGSRAAPAGDVNNDGFDDFLVSANQRNAPSGTAAGFVYVIFGHDNSTTFVDIDLLIPDNERYLSIYGAGAQHKLGFSLSRAGDVNGDGISDIVLGANLAPVFGRTNAGVTVVLFGPLQPSAVAAEMNALSTHGFQVYGAQAEDKVGYSVSGGGDLNGDGYDDIVIGARYMDPFGRTDAGSVYVIFGHSGSTTAFPDIDLLNFVSGPTGFQIFGAAPHHAVGKTVACAGDVNGDGIGDLLLSAYTATASGRSQAGVAYVMFGTQPAPSSQPSSCPSSQPSGVPSSQPTTAPSAQPSRQPTSQPSTQPSRQPNSQPTGLPTCQPSSQPTCQPSKQPAALPTSTPSAQPTTQPSGQPTAQPSSVPSRQPSAHPSAQPSRQPSAAPSQWVDPAHRDLYLETFPTSPRGFHVSNNEDNDQNGVGASLTGLGDVNGDGIDDFAVGGRNGGLPSGETDAGAVMVFYGRAATSPAFTNINPTTYSFGPSEGFIIYGALVNDEASATLTNAGDINGDGINDIIIGAYSATPIGTALSSAGIAYIVFGRDASNPFPSELNLVTMARNDGLSFRVNGENSGDSLASALSGVGDFNGDGYDDIIIGAYAANSLTRNDAGAAYVIFGHNNSTIPFTDIDAGSFTTGSTGFKIFGAKNSDYAGCSVSGAGDFNGDGYDDIIVGARKADQTNKGDSGKVYVIFGHNDSFTDIDLLDFASGPAGFILLGSHTNSQLGKSVSGAGDMNGDGYADIVVGEYHKNYLAIGAAYVIFGRPPSPAYTDIDLATMTFGTLGFRVIGANAGNWMGNTVSRAGDVNGDGYADIIVSGLYGRDASTAVVFGHRSSTSFPDIDTYYSLGDRGYRIYGVGVGVGYALSAAGDVNSDGIDDFLVGAPYFNNALGRAYVIYGNSATPSSQPSSTPSAQPTRQPTGQPSSLPTAPTCQPSSTPSAQPTSQPSLQPVAIPSAQPSVSPSTRPTCQPTALPSTQPSSLPSAQPSVNPSSVPTSQPSLQPVAPPSAQPSASPSANPSCQPTSHPSAQPNSLPSMQPSANPSAQPLSKPSAQPTSLPTAQPSVVPSCSPSAQPSMKPTAQPTDAPTCQPSSLPTTQPTAAPSVQPSSEPSSQPSSMPSTVPTCVPSCRPSSQPSSSPSRQPSSQPSSIPSCQLSSAPSQQPSTQPSAQPSMQPIQEPSAQPSVQPTQEPSGQPSAHPSSQPSAEPSVSPTAAPSSSPSALPSAAPTCLPLSAPTSQPSAVPSAQPSERPSVRPSAVPSSDPSAQPSSQPSNSSADSLTPPPSASPSPAPTVSPSQSPSLVPTVSPSCMPTQQPSVQPTVSPTALSTAKPSAGPTIAPTLQPGVQPTAKPVFSVAPSVRPSVAPSTLSPTLALPFNVTITTITPHRNSLTVRVQVTSSVGVYVYCGAHIGAQYNLTSSIGIRNQGFFAVAAPNAAVVLNITELTPFVTYSVFCTAVSNDGLETFLPAVQRSRTVATTLCCRTVSVSLLTTNMREKAAAQRAIAVSVDVAPDSALSLQLTFTEGFPTASVNYPSVFQWNDRSIANAVQYATVVAGSPGTHLLSAVLSGTSAGAYRVVFVDQQSLSVKALNVAPPVPLLQQAAFNNEGSAVTLSFDSPTDKGGYFNTFPCAKLLNFSGNAAASCLWYDASKVVIYPSYNAQAPLNVLSVDGSVTVYPRNIRAACTITNATECKAWGTVLQSSLLVSGPASPLQPTVIISVPAALGGCSSLTVDLTTSRGAAGRPWARPQFRVLTSAGATAAALQLEAYLTANFTLNPPTVVPFTAFQKGFTYSIQATLCNFLRACASAVKVVVVSSSVSAVPIVSILGQATRAVFRNAQLVLNSNAYTQSCSGAVSSANLDYSWSIRQLLADGTFSSTTLRSTSQSPTVFRLPAYTLAASTQYQVTLTVKSLLSSLSTEAAITVSVQRANLIARVAGGSTKYLRVGEAIELDASQSFDEDVLSTKGLAAGLSFQWTCVQVSPVFRPDCPLTVPNSLNTSVAFEKVAVSATYVAQNSTSLFTLTVLDVTRSSTAVQVEVIATEALTPTLSISTTLATLTNINTARQLVLYGSLKLFAPCSAAWSVDDQGITISSVSRTPTARYLLPSAQVQGAVPFNLVIMEGSLPQRSTLVFSLTCGTTSTSLTVSTNGAPLPGAFDVSPPSGDELSTVFTFTATQWSDPDLPLTYQFGFQSVTSLSNLVIVSKSEFSYTSTTLPAGSEERGQALSCTLQVYDNMNAFTTLQKSVIVHTVTEEKKDESLLKLLQSNTGSVDSAKNIISVVSTALNSVNCSAVQNCSVLNRQPCSKTSGECGACLAGYIGDAGDRSSLCIPAVEVAAANATGTLLLCTGNSDCAFNWQICDPLSRACVAPPKTCSRNCSDSGECIYVNRVSGAVQPTCALDDLNCEGVCSCAGQTSGAFCEISINNLRRRREVRSNLIGSLGNLTALEDVNAESVSAWSASLYSLSIQPYELSLNDVKNVAAIANSTLRSAVDLGVEAYENIAGVLQATDTIASLLKYNYNPNDYNDQNFNVTTEYQNNTAAAIVHTVSAFGDLVTRSMVLGQNATTLMYDNFRLSVHLDLISDAGSNATFVSPQSDFELLTGAPPSSAILTPAAGSGRSSTVAVKMVAVYPRSYSPDTSAFVSNPLMLQVQSQDEDDAAPSDYLSTIEFTFQNNKAQHRFMQELPVNFTTVCTKRNESERHSFVCPESGHALSHNCSQGAGVHTSYCPKPAPGCAKLGVDSADISIYEGCKVMSYNLTYTTCSCSLANSGRRRLTTEEKLLDDSGATNMMASTVFIASDFVESFSAADDFNSPSDAARVLVVIVMLSVIWVPGLLVIAVEGIRKMTTKKHSKPEDVMAVARKSVMDYVTSVVPAVFSEGGTTMSRMWAEVVEHHVFFQLFSAQASHSSRREKICKSLTVFTFMLFLIAAFFDISEPADDGSCVNYTNERSCLKRSSPFDSEQTYCQWTSADNDDKEEYTCSYSPQSMSLTELFYLTVLTTILTAIATIPLDYLFGIISAPTALSLQGSKVMDTFSAVVAGARRMSNIAMMRTAKTEADANTAAQTNNGRLSFTTLFAAASSKKRNATVMANREVPEELAAASEVARASMALVKANTTAMAVEAAMAAQRLKARSVRIQSMHLLGDQDPSVSEENDDGSGSEVRKAEETRVLSKFPALEALYGDIIQQRQLMNDQAEDTVVFDAQWGVVRSGTGLGPAFSNSTNNSNINKRAYRLSDRALQAVGDDVLYAESEAKKLCEVLPNYSMHHAGLEILHLFMVDLLGRNTPAAKIYQEKFGEEFGHSQVVVMAQKVGAVVLLFCLNAFFAYFIMLKAFQKGYEWQIKFLICSIVQFAVEVLVFETSECVWLNYLVPSFIRKEVMVAARQLMMQVDKVTAAPEEFAVLRKHKSSFFLNAPAHLFLSMRVAQGFPQLLESMIVGSYTHHLPGEICRTWPHFKNSEMNDRPADPSEVFAPTQRSILPKSLVRGVVLALNMFITIPYLYQRVIIRFLQPMIVSAISVVWFLAIQSVISAAVLGSLFAVCVAYLVWGRYKARRAAQLTVAPSETDPHALAIDILPVPTFIELDSDGKEVDGGSDDNSDSSSSEDGEQTEVAVRAVGGASAGLMKAAPAKRSARIQSSAGRGSSSREDKPDVEGDDLPFLRVGVSDSLRDDDDDDDDDDVGVEDPAEINIDDIVGESDFGGGGGGGGNNRDQDDDAADGEDEFSFDGISSPSESDWSDHQQHRATVSRYDNRGNAGGVKVDGNVDGGDADHSSRLSTIPDRVVGESASGVSALSSEDLPLPQYTRRSSSAAQAPEPPAPAPVSAIAQQRHIHQRHANSSSDSFSIGSALDFDSDEASIQLQGFVGADAVPTAGPTEQLIAAGEGVKGEGIGGVETQGAAAEDDVEIGEDEDERMYASLSSESDLE